MKKYGPVIVMLLALLAAGFAGPKPASALLVNAGFDDEFFGWEVSEATTDASASIVRSSNLPANPGAVAPFLQLSARNYASITVSQSFDANENDTLAGVLALTSKKGTPVTVSISLGDTSLINLTQESHDWMSWQWIAPTTGRYTIAYSLAGGNNKNNPSTALFDTVDNTSAPVPIPASALLLASGLIGLIAIRRRKSR